MYVQQIADLSQKDSLPQKDQRKAAFAVAGFVVLIEMRDKTSVLEMQNAPAQSKSAPKMDCLRPAQESSAHFFSF